MAPKKKSVATTRTRAKNVKKGGGGRAGKRVRSKMDRKGHKMKKKNRTGCGGARSLTLASA